MEFFKSKKTAEPDLGEVGAYFKDEIAQKKATADAARIEKVKTVQDQERSLEAARDHELAELQLSLNESVARTKSAEAALEAARSEEDNCRTAVWNASFNYQRRLAQNAAEKAQLNPEFATKFHAEMLVEMEHTRQKFRSTERRESGNWLSGKRRIVVETNDQAIESKLNAIRAAISETESPEFLCLTSGEIGMRLDELRAALPEIEEREIRSDLPDVRDLQTSRA